MSDTKKAAKITTASKRRSKGFTDDEKAAMRERARELKAEAIKADGEKELLTAIAKMEEPARSMAKKLHALMKATAPALAPKTWYGMPAYANDGMVVCFFKNAGKFKTRYSTLGFSDKANLDAGRMWPTEFALTELTAAAEKRIAALVKKACAEDSARHRRPVRRGTDWPAVRVSRELDFRSDTVGIRPKHSSPASHTIVGR